MDQWKFAATELSILLFAIFNFDICYFEYSIFQPFVMLPLIFNYYM